MPIQPSDYIIGTIIFTVLTLGLVGIMAEVNTSDTSIINNQEFSDFNNSFNKYSEVTNSVNSLETSITGSQVDNGVFGTVNGVLNSLLNTVWTTFKFLFSSFSFMTDAYTGLTTILGIPSWIPILIGLLVTVIIAFGIFAAITRTSL